MARRDSHCLHGMTSCRGQFINVGCMMPWMDYQPRTLAEIIEREEAASHALRLWNKQGRISNLLHPISHLPDRYMAASFFPADVSQICAEIWHEHPSKIGVCQPVIFKITPPTSRPHTCRHPLPAIPGKIQISPEKRLRANEACTPPYFRHTQGVALACHHKPGQPLYLFPSFLFVNLNVDVSSLAIQTACGESRALKHAFINPQKLGPAEYGGCSRA